MTKIGNLEIPDGIKLVFSFPQLEQTEINDITTKMKESSFTFIVTNMHLKVLAKNKDVIVIEGTR
jgi:hypothetical protein